MTELAIAVAVVGWFVTPNIKELMDWARSYIGKKYNLYSGLQENLEKLAEALEWIDINVGGASWTSFVRSPAAIGQLWKLKDTIHDAEELLDEFQYEILEASSRNYYNSFVGNKKSLDKLEKLLERLHELGQNSKDLHNILRSGEHYNPKPPASTISELTNRRLFGYKKEYEDLISRLTGGDARVVGIIGHAGMGKTELARWAFNGYRIKNKFGTRRIWVCVCGIFSQTGLSRQIWESLSARSDSRSKITDDKLVSELKRIIGNGRYLLVLDGVCHDESAATHEQIRTWETVLAPFKQDEKIGSRILITTRTQICLETLGATSWMNLRGINDTNELYRLLKEKAFGDEEAWVNSNQKKALMAYVHKIHGSPLAAENVASMFRGKCMVQNSK